MIQLTPELSEICGIHAGDGYMRTRGRNKGEIDISGNLEEQEYYDKHVIPLFNKVFDLHLKGRTFSRGTYGFVCYKREVRELFFRLGFPFGSKSLTVKVPKQILDSENSVLYSGFLRGLLDTDGHIGFKKRTSGKYCKFKLNNHYYPTIVLTTISKKLSEEISFILNKLEIKHFVYSSQPKNLRDNYYFRIIINGVDRLERWMKLIGSKNPVKFSRYLVWKKFGFCPTHTTLQQRKDILSGKLDLLSIGS
ncbi:MAG TPA: LAGLIDADG family homing endonuclease [Candidatus Nanoarchaeia archaeon]|nr:LAGLIDADG family homing endonuclease [Candidatus Nanoarchaeia archaeon]